MEKSELEKRLRSILAGRRTAALATVTADGRPWVRFVTLRLADDLSLRIITGASTRKAAEIRVRPHVHLTVGALNPPDDSAYLQIAGLAEITTDPSERRALWDDEYLRYFGGPDDPEYVVIRVRPDLIEYTGPDSPTPSVWRLPEKTVSE
jgi:general stress protein 26